MTTRRAKLLSLIAVAGAVALTSASAQAQYLTRPYYRSIHHPYYRAQALYNAQAYIGGGISVLPPTTVLPYYGSSYDPYGNLPSVYGCCTTTQKEHVGLAGAGAEGGPR